jgi:hypothetical protein|tara:strand:+ start:385 stop:936 length:552 start_codon:yes stop_codon:yes gene_type:complete
MTNKKESPAKIIGIVSKALKYGPKIAKKYGPKIAKAIKKNKKVTPKKTDVKLVKTKTKKPTTTKPKVTKTKVTKPKVTKTKTTTTTTKKTTGKIDKRSKAWRDETKKLREEMEAKYAPKQSSKLSRYTKRTAKIAAIGGAGTAAYTYFGSKKSKLKRNEVNIPQPKQNTYKFNIPEGTKFKKK